MTGKERAMLRKLANPIDPVIYIGKEGITEQIVREVINALEAREIIKGCVQQGSPLDAREALTILCDRTKAEPIQVIGRRFVLYRESKKNPHIMSNM